MTMILSFLKNPKILGSIAGVVGIVWTIVQLLDSRYDAGYDAAVTAMQSEYTAKLQEKQKQFVEHIEAQRLQQQQYYEAELQRVKDDQQIITKVEKEIEYVTQTEIVEVTAQCSSLATTVNRMRNKAYRIVNSAGRTASNPGEDTTRLANILQPPITVHF